MDNSEKKEGGRGWAEVGKGAKKRMSVTVSTIKTKKKACVSARVSAYTFQTPFIQHFCCFS